MDLRKISVNGSLVGPGYYSRAIAASPEPPQQAFYLLDDKRGKTAVSPIWVSDPSAEKECSK
jgi:hypothetical protein